MKIDKVKSLLIEQPYRLCTHDTPDIIIHGCMYRDIRFNKKHNPTIIQIDDECYITPNDDFDILPYLENDFLNYHNVAKVAEEKHYCNKCGKIAGYLSIMIQLANLDLKEAKKRLKNREFYCVHHHHSNWCW